MKHFNTDIEALEVLANKHSRIKNRKDAELFLYKKYEPLMKKSAAKLMNQNMEFEDLMQTYYLGMRKAIDRTITKGSYKFFANTMNQYIGAENHILYYHINKDNINLNVKNEREEDNVVEFDANDNTTVSVEVTEDYNNWKATLCKADLKIINTIENSVSKKNKEICIKCKMSEANFIYHRKRLKRLYMDFIKK